MSRSSFLVACGATGLLGIYAPPWWQSAQTRSLRLQRLDDNERWQGVWFDRVLDDAGYENVCWMLRDAHVPIAQGVVAIAPKLLQVAWEIQVAHRSLVEHPILCVHSGYRTPETNAQTEGAVSDSQHIAGAALDFHVIGVPLADSYRLSRDAPARGGLGYYPRGTSGGWLHVDVAARRSWTG